MLEYPRWKFILAALILVLSTLYALPNLYKQDAAVQITANRGSVVDAALRDRVAGLLDAAGIPYKSVAEEGGNLLVRLASDDQLRAAQLLRSEFEGGYTVAQNLASTVPRWLELIGGRPMLLGLDLQGGVHFLLQVDQKAALEKRETAYAEQWDTEGLASEVRQYLNLDLPVVVDPDVDRRDCHRAVGIGDGAGVDQVRIVQCDAAVTSDETVSPDDLSSYAVHGFGGSIPGT